MQHTCYYITVFPRSDVVATIQGQHLIERIQSEWYSAAVVPESHLFLIAPPELGTIVSPPEDALPLGKLNSREIISR